MGRPMKIMPVRDGYEFAMASSLSRLSFEAHQVLFIEDGLDRVKDL